LGFLRLSVAKSRSRIEALGIKSEQVDRFVDPLWFNSEIEFRFRRKRFRSVKLTIEALDLLSQTAARYGRRGRKVFVVNQEPIVNAIRLIECLPLEEAEEVLVEPLTRWLEHPPEFDPEGWGAPALWRVLILFFESRSRLEKILLHPCTGIVRREWVSHDKNKKGARRRTGARFQPCVQERSRLSD
jgi:hypothetical protein